MAGTDSYVQVQPNSTGAKVDVSEYTTTSGTVERQRMEIPGEVAIRGDVLDAILTELRMISLLLAEGFGVPSRNIEGLRSDLSERN